MVVSQVVWIHIKRKNPHLNYGWISRPPTSRAPFSWMASNISYWQNRTRFSETGYHTLTPSSSIVPKNPNWICCWVWRNNQLIVLGVIGVIADDGWVCRNDLWQVVASRNHDQLCYCSCTVHYGLTFYFSPHHCWVLNPWTLSLLLFRRITLLLEGFCGRC